jgi:peroxiredoxin
VDFWATWCTGCKQEITWFAHFQTTYRPKGLPIVGVSMDGEGWKVVRPFLEHTHIPYRIVLGNDAIAEKFGIQTMPDTFLIDRQGRIAAAYKGGLVDRENIETNIKKLLAEP